jgi:hypothetical protein
VNSSLTTVETVLLPQSVTAGTHAHLRSAGRRGLEGMALWAGVQDDRMFEVREVIAPRQQGIRSDHGLAVVVDGSELHRINLHLYRSGLRLLAQIHSHPTEAYHSAMDDEYAIATALGSFSLVVPDFAREALRLERCAVYRLTARPWWKPGSRPEWSEIAADRVTTIFRTVEG